MRKTSILNKLNHKLQAHARVCEENRELEKKQNLVEIFCGQTIDFERLWKKSDTAVSDETRYKDSS